MQNSDHLRLCQQPRAAHALRSDQNTKEEILIDYTEEKNTSEEEFPSSVSFMTSTPQKLDYECEECANKEQCIDCFVREDNGVLTWPHRVHF